MPKYLLGDVVFPTKAAALMKVREILYRVSLRTPLAGDDYLIISGLLDRHYAVRNKLSSGLSHFEVREFWDHGKKQRGFFVVAPNGSAIDFSIHVAFGNKRSDSLTDFKVAARKLRGC